MNNSVGTGSSANSFGHMHRTQKAMRLVKTTVDQKLFISKAVSNTSIPSTWQQT